MDKGPQNRTWVLQKKHFCWVSWHIQIHLARQQFTAVLNQSVPSPPPTTLNNISPHLRVTSNDSFLSVWKKIILRRASSTIFPSFPGKLSRSLASILHSSCQKSLHWNTEGEDTGTLHHHNNLLFWLPGSIDLGAELKRRLWHPLQEKPNWCTMSQQKWKAAVSTYKYLEIKVELTSFNSVFCPRKRAS